MTASYPTYIGERDCKKIREEKDHPGFSVVIRRLADTQVSDIMIRFPHEFEANIREAGTIQVSLSLIRRLADRAGFRYYDSNLTNV